MALEKDSLYIASIIRSRHYILCAFMALPRFISFTSSQSQSLFVSKVKWGLNWEKICFPHRKNLLDPNFFVPFTLFFIVCIVLYRPWFVSPFSSIVCCSLYCYVNQHDMYTINLLQGWGVRKVKAFVNVRNGLYLFSHPQIFSYLFFSRISFFLHIP